MYVPFVTEDSFLQNPDVFNVSVTQCAHRCVTLVIKWLNASWRLTTTKWSHSNSIWMEMLQRKSLFTWLVQILSLLSCQLLNSNSNYSNGFNVSITICIQVENGFILLLEKEIFIDQLKDIVDKAEDMLSEDVEGERSSTLTCSSQQGQVSEGQVGEVRGISLDVHVTQKIRHGQ